MTPQFLIPLEVDSLHFCYNLKAQYFVTCDSAYTLMSDLNLMKWRGSPLRVKSTAEAPSKDGTHSRR